jgi:hypothetical protein
LLISVEAVEAAGAEIISNPNQALQLIVDLKAKVDKDTRQTSRRAGAVKAP